MPAQTKAQTTKDWWVDQMAQCESGGRQYIKIVDSNDYYSYGYLQFQLATWIAYGRPFGASKANIYSIVLQRKVAELMLDKGLWWNWKHCYLRTVAKDGAYPTKNTP